MADLLGPSGQPIQSNPFTQSQGMSSTVSINTSQAQKTMEDFQRVLDGMMKGFSGNWERGTKDRLAAEERFYRAVGDKAKAREAEITRHRDLAIAAIKEESSAEISKYEREIKEGKRTQDELLKYKKDMSERATYIEQEAQKKMKLGFIERASSFAGGIGGPIGGTVAAVGNLLSNPVTAIIGALGTAIFETAIANARSARVGASLAGAGMGLGSAAGAGGAFTTGLFGGPFSKLGLALGADQQAALVGTLAGSRTMVDQARGGGFGSITSNLGLFANILPDASKEMELFTDATKNLGMSQKDISHTFMTSRVSGERLKITQLDAISAQIEMQKALRNITNDGTVAANVLYNVGSFFHDIGKSEAETKRMTLGIGQAGANLPLSQIAGMFAFTQGKMPSEQALFGTNGIGGMMGKGGSGVFGLMGSFLTKVGGQFKDPMQRIYAADALNRQLGLGIQTQDLPQFFNLSNRLMTGGIGQEDYAKKVAALSAQSKQLSVDGIDKLLEVVGPGQLLENFLTNFWKRVDEYVVQFVGHAKRSSPALDAVRRDIIKQQKMS